MICESTAETAETTTMTTTIMMETSNNAPSADIVVGSNSKITTISTEKM